MRNLFNLTIKVLDTYLKVLQMFQILIQDLLKITARN